MTRRATQEDVPEIVRLGADFHAMSPYRAIPYDPEAFAEFAGRLIEHGVIFLSEDGMIGGLLNPLYFNPSVVMGAELFWFARQGGRALREAFEEWAKAGGAQGVQFSGLADDNTDRIRKHFERAGYTAAEQAYFKRF